MERKNTQPPMSRAERRRLARAGKAPVSDLAGLAARLPSAAAGIRSAEAARGARVVEAVIETAAARGQGLAEAAADLGSGAAAFRAGAIDHQAQTERPDGPLARADCRSGCAFCCVLSGEDGGLITAQEAEALHLALTPFRGAPDGRAWHPRACPALDPDTLGCRAYAVRPLICRAYFSTDVEDCRRALKGEEGAGTAVLGSYPLYLAIHAIARALIGVAKAPTFSLARVAAAALEGKPLAEALKAAKHAPSVLNGELARTERRASPRP